MGKVTFFAFALLVFSLLQFSSAASALTTCGPGIGTPIVYLSSTTNAHASTTNSYPIAIGCTESTGALIGISQPNPVNVLALSATTNAHVEIPELGNYSTIISIGTNGAGGIVAQLVDTGVEDCDAIQNSLGESYATLVYLSDITNAHVELPPGGSSYQFAMCVSYDPAPAPLPEDVLKINSLSGTGLPVAQNGTGQITVPTVRNVAIPSQYPRIATLQFSGVCDLADVTPGASGKTCAGISRYSDMRLEAEAFNTNQPSLFSTHAASVRVKKYATGPSLYDGDYSAFTTNHPSNPATTGAGFESQASVSDNYTIDPSTMGLAAGNYKFLVINYAADYDRTGVGPDNVEVASSRANNVASTTFAVTAVTGGSAAGGDVYVLQDISFPNVYENAPINVNVTLQNKQAQAGATQNVSVLLSIRDSHGVYVPGYSPGDNVAIPFSFTGASASETLTQGLTLQNPNGGVFEIGETYTLYATAPAYVDAVPANSESITANNSAFKTFTTIETPQSVSVPDAPWWMSAVVALGVMAFLYVGSRKESAN